MYYDHCIVGMQRFAPLGLRLIFLSHASTSFTQDSCNNNNNNDHTTGIASSNNTLSIYKLKYFCTHVDSADFVFNPSGHHDFISNYIQLIFRWISACVDYLWGNCLHNFSSSSTGERLLTQIWICWSGILLASIETIFPSISLSRMLGAKTASSNIVGLAIDGTSCTVCMCNHVQ